MAKLNPIVREIVDATVAAVEPERIVLFGSRARGDERSGSDLDLLVVAGAPSLPAMESGARAGNPR